MEACTYYTKHIRNFHCIFCPVSHIRYYHVFVVRLDFGIRKRL